MAEAFDQIAAPVPLVALSCYRQHGVVVQEQQLPAGQQGSETERRDQAVLRRFLRHRGARHQESVDRVEIGVGDAGEMLVRQGWVQVLAVARDTVPHRAPEGISRPVADACPLVGRYVGGVERSERRFQGPATGERRPLGRRVADDAVADRGQRRTPADDGRVEVRQLRRRYGGDFRLPGYRRENQRTEDAGRRHGGQRRQDRAAFHRSLAAGFSRGW